MSIQIRNIPNDDIVALTTQLDGLHIQTSSTVISGRLVSGTFQSAKVMPDGRIGITKFIFRIIFKSVAFLALGTATYWLYTHPEHEYHGWYIGTAIWVFIMATDIADDLSPESRAPWNQ